MVKKALKMKSVEQYLEKNGYNSHSSRLSSSSSRTSVVAKDQKVDLGRVEIYLVLRDMLSMSLAEVGRGYNDRMLFMLPDCLRLKSELGRYISEEGVLLFVRRLKISVDDWVKLSAFVMELGNLRSSLSDMRSKSSNERLPEQAIVAGWLHHRRYQFLKSICCATEQHRDELLSTYRRRLKHYENAKSVMSGKDAKSLEDFASYCLPVITRNKDLLRSARIKDGKWTVDAVSRTETTHHELVFVGEMPKKGSTTTSSSPRHRSVSKTNDSKALDNSEDSQLQKPDSGGISVRRCSELKLVLDTINKQRRLPTSSGDSSK